MSQILFGSLCISWLTCAVGAGRPHVGAKKVNTRFYCIFFFRSVSMCLHQADTIMAAGGRTDGRGAYVKTTWSHPRTDKR